MEMDKGYWDSYYLNHGSDDGIKLQSSFADFCSQNFFGEDRKTIVELGSGNGRDAIFFAHYNHEVVAIDQSITAIEHETKQIHGDIKGNLTAIAADFVNYDFESHKPIDVFYSRFSLHAITKPDEKILLLKAYRSLNKGGMFCVEVRTIKDPLCGEGESCGDNAYRTDHYRRFIDASEFVSQVLLLGFELVYFTEENNLSIYKNDNPVLMRVILRKV